MHLRIVAVTRGEKAPELGNRPFLRQRDPFCEDLRIRQGHADRHTLRISSKARRAECSRPPPARGKRALVAIVNGSILREFLGLEWSVQPAE